MLTVNNQQFWLSFWLVSGLLKLIHALNNGSTELVLQKTKNKWQD
jgi:hypothetical protein